MLKRVEAIFWGRSRVAECPFCKSLIDEYEKEGCPHVKSICPLGRDVFMFEG